MFTNKFIQRFLKASQIVVLTGDTLCTEAHDILTQGNNGALNELFTIDQLKNDQQKFWENVKKIRQQLASCKPNLGHYALVDLENRYDDFTLITTSIDGLHQIAGNKNLIELRGNIRRNICQSCGKRFYHLREDDPVVPVCPACGNSARPDVLLNDETIDEQILKKAQQAAADAELFITVCLKEVHKDHQALPLIAKANGAYLVELNKEPGVLTDSMDEFVAGNPAKLLTGLVLLLEKI
ncbi:Silent information regulator protein Sir2 [Caldithrix abyssi DSM 13497]|uniref:protein acetyllysine N-acetyltransferase n=1 Tax=Caldithrix abyssi DSM 13497 TaxID=880073 RepID=H1XWV5_CALAY|nr:FYDLN acid domain-containing protein [Caldithrix abyssi]APF19159.1 NAD-dependent deacetylase [Caldithrix abyssi DSM 13497]EHO43081.1 Silent information regulator protein Sir2 [Caldithrix abyssi DSM 13497]